MMKPQNNSSEQLKHISSKISSAWNAHLTKQCWLEAEKYFGKDAKELSLQKCPEPEFKAWWENNKKDIPYNGYYYTVAQFVWDEYATFITP